MSDEQDKELFTARPPAGSEGSDVYNAATVAHRASADLLDLVRAAEEEAWVAARKIAETAAAAEDTQAVDEGAAPPGEEFVDVGDEAVETPSSIVGLRPPDEGREARPSPVALPVPPPLPRTDLPGAPSPAPPDGTIPPAVGIVVMLALAIAALALLAR